MACYQRSFLKMTPTIESQILEVIPGGFGLTESSIAERLSDHTPMQIRAVLDAMISARILRQIQVGPTVWIARA